MKRLSALFVGGGLFVSALVLLSALPVTEGGPSFSLSPGYTTGCAGRSGSLVLRTVGTNNSYSQTVLALSTGVVAESATSAAIDNGSMIASVDTLSIAETFIVGPGSSGCFKAGAKQWWNLTTVWSSLRSIQAGTWALLFLRDVGTPPEDWSVDCLPSSKPMRGVGEFALSPAKPREDDLSLAAPWEAGQLSPVAREAQLRGGAQPGVPDPPGTRRRGRPRPRCRHSPRARRATRRGTERRLGPRGSRYR